MATPEESEILDIVRTLLKREFGLAPERMHTTTRLVADLDFDSIDAISLAVRVEEETGLKVDEKTLQSVHTVGDVVDLIARHLAQGTS